MQIQNEKFTVRKEVSALPALTYSSAAAQLTESIRYVNEAQAQFASLGSGIPENYDASQHQDTLGILRESTEKAILYPLRNQSEVVQNTLNYSTGGDGQTLKYDVTSGASSFSAYLQSNQDPISGSSLKTADYDVLSHLSYASKWSSDQSYQNAVNRENVTVKEYCSELLKHGDQLSNVERQYLQELSESDRFSGLTVDHSIGDTGTNGANTRILVLGSGDGHAIVSVQGTNGTVVDWQTNGKFAESRPTSEETWVASVVDVYAREYKSIDLTGHSQGGREAVTTAILMSPENRGKITRIVSNDGPGYSRDFIDRYGQQIKEIEGKVLNIRPTDSKVGELLHSVGEIQYVKVIDVVNTERDGAVKNCDHHEGITWYIDQDGNYITAEGHDLYTWTSLTQLTPALSDALSMVLPEDRVSYYLDQLMELGGDEEGKFEFGNFLRTENIGPFISLAKEFKADLDKHLDEITQTQLSDDEYFIRSYCKEVADVFGEISTVLTVTQVACTVLAAIIPPAAPVFAAIIAIIEEVKLIPAIVGGVFRVLEFILDYKAIKRAQQKKKERFEYISGHGEIDVSVPLLLEAAKMLRDAQMWMRAAYTDYQSMLHSFQGKLRAAISEELGASEETTEKWSGVPYLAAKTHCWARGVRDFDKADPYLGKASNKLSEIADDSLSIVSAEGTAGDSVFTVFPARLSDAASKGASCYELIHEELSNIETGVKDLGKSWKGDDYDSINQKALAPIPQYEQYSKDLGECFSTLISIATAYSKYQENTIEKFQNIDLYFA